MGLSGGGGGGDRPLEQRTRVEGQVNRLKTIKRQMHGLAGVELLRARLIPLPVEPSVLQRE